MKRLVHTLLRWFNLHPLWQWGTVPVWGSRLRAPTFDRWLALRLHQGRLMGVADARFLRAHVRPGMNVVDIGANQGLYSLLLARLAGPGGNVWAFEPDGRLYAALEENVALNEAGTIRPFHAALGASAGTMTLHRSLLNSGDNRLAAKASQAGPREAVKIRVERLDNVLAGERINFMKMDVQGWEMEVFRGMQRLLDAPRNTDLTIYFEFWPQGLRDAGSEPLELLELLMANDFAIYHPHDGRLGAAAYDLRALTAGLKPGAYTNLCAVRKSVS